MMYIYSLKNPEIHTITEKRLYIHNYRENIMSIDNKYGANN
jgi:hypothetical protein